MNLWIKKQRYTMSTGMNIVSAILSARQYFAVAYFAVAYLEKWPTNERISEVEYRLRHGQNIHSLSELFASPQSLSGQ